MMKDNLIMSMPNGFLDELRNRLSIVDVIGRKVMWDNKKSNPGKGDMWAPCPFHHEKTASFHVEDTKGFYYCFGCQAKGDAIKFVRETENVSFMEAVGILAQEAGMQMPERDPQAQEKLDKGRELSDILEVANRFFRLSLKQQIGYNAQEYLKKRGMSQETQDQFEIGFAPAGNVLLKVLQDQGISVDLAIESGVVARPDDGRNAYDFYRDRITFPIRDVRGRLVSFGGRAMDQNARAKYLNGPERLIFDKGRALYNHGPARSACGRGSPLIVAEGYMDVIALSAAGLEACVAPLGTAITDRQLQMMWRMSPEPVIALDGDKAGLRAAYRLIDLAMPMLEAGVGLRFAIMPDGLDPDDLIKQRGPQVMRDVIDNALPMVSLLWRRETEGKDFDSPERRAALDKSLRGAIGAIQDLSIKRHYGDILKDMRFELFRGKKQSQGAKSFKPAANSRGKSGYGSRKQLALPSESVKTSMLVSDDPAQAEVMREAVILATLLKNPEQIEEFIIQLESLHSIYEEHRNIIRMLLIIGGDHTSEQLIELLAQEVGIQAVNKLFSHPTVKIAPSVRKPDPELAQRCLNEEFAKLKAKSGHGVAISEEMDILFDADDEKLTWRLRQAAEARNKAIKAEAEDRTEFDVAENGVEISRDEREVFQNLLNSLGAGRQNKK